jgi:hypothetical protein
MQAAEPAGEAAIWTRVIMPDSRPLSPAAARALLRLDFSDEDRARMSELARKNQEGHLTRAERQELESYLKVGDVLSLIHLKARKSLAR